MKIKPYLLEKQPVVFQVLKNSFKNNKTSHAYIINGSKGSPVLETALYMAQSFVCKEKDENSLACENCINCQKIINKTYADFVFINGFDLKTEATLSIQDEFNKSAIENENIKIYIIHLIEKAPVSSLNKLLKFIEEPTSNIVAIFTSNSVSSILPTIVSRCQVISLKEFMIKDLVDYLLENKVDTHDAYLISKISNNAEKNLETVTSASFANVKEICKNALSFLAKKSDYFIVYFQTEGLNKLSDNADLDLFLDVLQTCLMEAIIVKEDKLYEPKFFKEEIICISGAYNHIDYMIDDVTKAKIDLLSNANKNLVIDKLLINLLRRWYHGQWKNK